MAAGGDLKETVMTIPFLRTCITNVIADLEKRFTSLGDKRRALVQPEAPWKWFTSYELGFPLVSDEHDRPMHPLVETFVDDQLEAHWAEKEEANAPLLPPISQLQTLKEGWGDQAIDELPPTIDRATTRERFSTSYIARNPQKLPEIEIDDEDFLSMIKNPPAVGAVRIHMDPESLDTFFGGYTASTFQGVATLITPAGPFRMEGARWHLLSQVFSSLEDIKIDLHKERLPQKPCTRTPTAGAWKILWQAKLAVGATTYIGDTALTATPFFDNGVRGDSTTWGSKSLEPRVINWTSLISEDQTAILPSLQSTSNWIVLALAGKSKPGTIPLPVESFVTAMTTKGKASEKGNGG